MKAAKNRTALKKATATYPVAYESERKRIRRRNIHIHNELERDNSEFNGEEPLPTRAPAFCDKYPKETS